MMLVVTNFLTKIAGHCKNTQQSTCFNLLLLGVFTNKYNHIINTNIFFWKKVKYQYLVHMSVPETYVSRQGTSPLKFLKKVEFLLFCLQTYFLYRVYYCI